MAFPRGRAVAPTSDPAHQNQPEQVAASALNRAEAEEAATPHRVGWSQRPPGAQLCRSGASAARASAALFAISVFRRTEGAWEAPGDALGSGCTSVIHTWTCVTVPAHS